MIDNYHAQAVGGGAGQPGDTDVDSIAELLQPVWSCAG